MRGACIVAEAAYSQRGGADTAGSIPEVFVLARKRGQNRRRASMLIVLGLLACGGYAWYFEVGPFSRKASPEPEPISPTLLASLRSEDHATTGNPFPEVSEKGAQSAPSSGPATPSAPSAAQGLKLIESARGQIQSGNLIAARQQLSEAMNSGLESAKQVEIRAELVRLGQATVFSPRVYADDPLAGQYIVAGGDTLEKIARKHKVTAGLLARINNIPNINLIRQGQTLKVLHGPFHAKVTKSAFRMDVYLQDTFVQSFPVGLGAEDGTPTGTWEVGEKLVNPTFYHPRENKVYAADDPMNPLGERWIALKGVAGNAVGQMRYGLHGTIEPDSIGRSVSLGCIRMHNPDVELVYDMLVPALSTVLVAD